MALERSGWRLALILSAGSGLLAALALPPLGLPPLLWVALALLWAQNHRPWTGFVWGFTALALSHRWLLALHPLDWIGVPGPLSLPLCVVLLACISALAGVLVWGWLALARSLDARRCDTALLLALLWGLVETLLARGPLFWLGLGASALPHDRPLAALAALGGAGLLAALQLSIGWLLWRLLLGPGRQRWLPALLAAVVISHGSGALVLASLPLTPDGSADAAPAAERVMVLQPAIPTRRKFEVDQRLALQRQLAAALELGRRQGAQLLLLPEGALGLEPDLAGPVPIELIGGGFRWHEGAELLEQRSSLLRFAPGERTPSSWLDKHRLVPLGEWVPLAQLVRWSGLSAVGGVEPGAPSRLLLRPGGAVAAAICYELSDGGALAAAVRDGAQWLLASANLDPYPVLLQRQFIALAQLRALETGRWLVSAANTGPSLLISPRGVVRDAIPLGKPAVGFFAVSLLHQLTPYDRCGEAPLLVSALGAVVLRYRAGRCV